MVDNIELELKKEIEKAVQEFQEALQNLKEYKERKEKDKRK